VHNYNDFYKKMRRNRLGSAYVDIKAIKQNKNKTTFLQFLLLIWTESILNHGFFFFTGRPYTTATQCDRVTVAWSLDEIQDFVIQRFPVLEDRPFNIMRGSAGSKLAPIEGLCGEVLRQTSSSTSNIVRLWVVPDEAIVHYPVGTTPTVCFYHC
jgi:hypothetical protein